MLQMWISFSQLDFFSMGLSGIMVDIWTFQSLVSVVMETATIFMSSFCLIFTFAELNKNKKT